MMRFLNLILLVILAHGLFAQSCVDTVSIQVGWDTIRLSNPTQAFSVMSNDVTDLSIMDDGKSTSLYKNPHFEKPISQLIFLTAETSELPIYSTKPTVVYVESYRSQSTGGSTMKSANKKDCELPPITKQILWREGLNDPKPNPESHTVNHVIIHHSATSNSATNYVEAVRNIYLYHTGQNGWDDIGYNYLIAPDGTLFAGRDGQGLADDNIKGAHFCGKNSGTMGVCLVGNYTDIEPSAAMLKTLQELLAWKLKKDNIQPYMEYKHPANDPDAKQLPTIAGHRDGCSTECPGEMTYPLLQQIRDSTAQELIRCGFAVSVQEFESEFTLIDVQNNPKVLKIMCVDMLGRTEPFDADSQTKIAPNIICYQVFWKDGAITTIKANAIIR